MTRNTLTNFRAEDFGSESKPGHLPGETVVDIDKKPVNETQQSQSDEVPTGTTREVLDWVGDDKDRARRALDREDQDETPRKSLTGKLKDLLVEDDDKNDSRDA